MDRRRTILAWALLAACSAMACSGVSSDGGQSGTGIAAIRGDVAAVTGEGPDVANIRVSLTGTNLSTRTDAAGRFELRGNASGPGELRFERERDGLFARTDVLIPAGGVLELEQIILDSSSGEARPTRQLVEFEGLVEALDCTNGAIRVTPKEDENDVTTVFTVDTTSATIRSGDTVLACSDLRVGDRLEARGETSDGSTLVNAEIKVEDREDDPSSEPNDQGGDQPGNDQGDDKGEHQDDNQPEDDQGDDPQEDHQDDDQQEDNQGDAPQEHDHDDDQPEDHSSDAPENEDLEA